VLLAAVRTTRYRWIMLIRMLLTFAVGATVGYTAKEARPDAIVREIHEIREVPGAPVIIHEPCAAPQVARDDELPPPLPPPPPIDSIQIERVVPVQPAGGLQGVVRDVKTGDKLAGVTVVATSKVSATQTAISDDNGVWRMSGLPSASYDLTFYYGDATGTLGGVAVSELDTRQADYSLDTSPTPLVVTFSGEE
jgi:hypothetical protein